MLSFRGKNYYGDAVFLLLIENFNLCFFFFQAEDGIRDYKVTGVQTCALPISAGRAAARIARPSPRAVIDLGADGRWAMRRASGAESRHSLCPPGSAAQRHQIGRASCRERG